MKCADAILKTAYAAGVRVCFANPGTTELSLVAALDDVGIRAVLGLSEGVVAGMADGYSRMARDVPMTLTHLGPGFANAVSNLHNARRARSAILNVVGDHPRWLRDADPPMASEVELLATYVSTWVRRSSDARASVRDVAEALAACARREIATLILPADYLDAPVDGPMVASNPPVASQPIDPQRIAAAARVLAAPGKTALLLGGAALSVDGQRAAARVAASSGCALLCETFAARLELGADLPRLQRIPYVPAMAEALLGDFEHVVLVGTTAPVAFFADDTKTSVLLAQRSRVILAEPTDDPVAALLELADRAGPASGSAPAGRPAPVAARATSFTARNVISELARRLPQRSIVVDEGVSAAGIFPAVVPVDLSCSYLALTGGACGFALAAAAGAALACPDRKVIALVGDGSALYNVQALWTQARESLDVVNVVFSNNGYRILATEFAARVEDRPRESANGLMEFGEHRIDWTSLCRGFGVRSHRATDLGQLGAALADALEGKGPALIEVVLP